MSNAGSDSDGIDWSLVTWEGSRRPQLRAWCKLSLRERLEALDAMGDVSEVLSKARAEGRLRSPTGSAAGNAVAGDASAVREPGVTNGESGN